MSFPKYPAYKDSGVEWLGEVPEHWSIYALKRIADLKSGESITAEDIEEEGEFAVFGGNGRRGFTKRYTHEGTYALIGRQGALCGNINYATGKFWASEHAVVAVPKLAVETHWLGELLRAMNLNQYSVSAAQPGLSVEIVGNLRIPVPPESEQTAIASFLDHETAKIDALVAEQEKLITLLQEKRQAVISHAVTKGLNPNVPVKDSGVEWLGQVPAHWEIKNIRHILEAIGDVDHYMPASVDTGVPYLMTGDLKEVLSEVNLDDCKRVSYTDYLELSKRIRSSKGDVVMARYATIGTLMYVDIDVDFLVSYSCVTLKPDCAKISGLYLFHYMKSVAFLQSVENQINTNTQGNVGVKDLQSIKIAVPPVHEQVKISNFLKNEIIKFDALMTEAHTAITLLKERRTALISAAVTGQIDVRNWSAQEGA